MADIADMVTVADLNYYRDGDALSLIQSATALVRSYCGWHVTPVVSETVTVDAPDGSATLLLPTLRVGLVESVTEQGATVDPADYEVQSAGYLRRLSGSWSSPVQVTIRHGFAAAPDVTSVVLAVVSRAQASPDGVVRKQVGPFSETYSQTSFNAAGGVSLLEHEKKILDRYRLPARP